MPRQQPRRRAPAVRTLQGTCPSGCAAAAACRSAAQQHWHQRRSGCCGSSRASKPPESKPTKPFFGQRAALHVLLTGDRRLAEQLQRVRGPQSANICEIAHLLQAEVILGSADILLKVSIVTCFSYDSRQVDSCLAGHIENRSCLASQIARRSSSVPSSFIGPIQQTLATRATPVPSQSVQQHQACSATCTAPEC